MTSVEQYASAVLRLLERYGMEAVHVTAGGEIPGSYWGEREAGLIGNRVYFRSDTPLHSVLHEACHYICMDEMRRLQLDRDAGGDHQEENAVCYLQIVLADELARSDSEQANSQQMNAQQMCRDMDAWGYTFRLGSAQAWFEHDANDAREWLLAHRIIDARGIVTGLRREQRALT